MNSFDSSLLSDKDKLNLTKSDLFDRIINLKLYAGEMKADGTSIVKDTYVIRSDWEIYYPDQYKALTNGTVSTSGKGYIRKCRIKPSIKVQYKQISSGTAIEMDIFISNFFMFDSSGQMLMSFNNITYPLLKVEVQMGYWGQFSRAPETWEEYSEFRYHDGAEVLTCNVNYTQTDKLPPDAVLHIHGYVGNCYGEPVKTQKKALNIKFADLETAFKRDTSKSLIEDYCFQNVTRRFLKTTVFTARERPSEIQVDTVTGRMDKASAQKYGIKVFCTQALKDASNKVEEEGRLNTSDNKEVDAFTAGLYSRTAVEALNSIRGVTGLDCTFQALKDGNYIALLTSELEDMEGLVKAAGKALADDVDSVSTGNALSQFWKNIIPAVNNITTDAICTILCPFFYFIDPFSELEFKSRYALGGIVSYYANFNVSENIFYALWMTVSFATVEDINECQIACTGGKKK